MRKWMDALAKTALGVGAAFLVVWGLGFVFPQNQISFASPKTPTEYTKVEEISAPELPEASASNPLEQSKTPAATPGKKDKKLRILTLGAANTLVFRQTVTLKSVAKIQRKLLDMSYALPKNATIYLVLNSPGGSISAGNLFIDTVKAIPQKVKTITLFSASMAYHIAQNLDERLILPSGVMMSHRARISGLSGELPGEAISQLKWILEELEDMDTKVANRLKMSLEDYREMIRDEYWVGGKKAVAQRSADQIVLVRCGQSLDGTEEEELETFFGTVIFTFSKCPMITAPLGIRYSRPRGKRPKGFFTFMDLLLHNQKAFVKDYIITEKYKDFVK